MMRHVVTSVTLITLLVSAFAGCAARPAAPPAATAAAPSRRMVPPGATAPLFSDLGDHHYGITARSELAQRYFDQGLTLIYGFNHAEAVRSFREAQRLDPTCAMCFWGEALALGPNINKPMDDKDVPTAWAALQKAQALADGATPKEQALIRALGKRYAAKPMKDRAPLDRAFAAAMRTVARAYPDDLDIQTMWAEAVMDTMPWNYYTKAHQPRPATLEVVRTLESVLARDPTHPGALHYYIHAVEASQDPGRAEAASDRLLHRVPGAGHLVHMPAHIYLRVGRYDDAVRANELAAKADESYFAQCLVQGFYPALYYPHNLHFLWSAASYDGRSALALATAQKIVGFVPPEKLGEYPFLEEMLPTLLFTQARFGRWDEILTAPPPPADAHYATGMWHYGRGLALVAKGRVDEAGNELGAVRAAAESPAMHTLMLVSIQTSAQQLLRIATRVLDGEIAAARGEWPRAIAAYETAVRLQDALTYSEPPQWYFPTRDGLGRVLLRAGRPRDAEAVYRRQLTKTPKSGWTLQGLAASLRAQGQDEAAAKVEQDFRTAWARADVTLTASVF
jgi:tetratricopeptide (TPR) repeat protein